MDTSFTIERQCSFAFRDQAVRISRQIDRAEITGVLFGLFGDPLRSAIEKAIQQPESVHDRQKDDSAENHQDQYLDQRRGRQSVPRDPKPRPVSRPGSSCPLTSTASVRLPPPVNFLPIRSRTLLAVPGTWQSSPRNPFRADSALRGTTGTTGPSPFRRARGRP